MVPGEMTGCLDRLKALIFRSMKWWTRAGISEFIWRRGGMWIGKTLSRNQKFSRIILLDPLLCQADFHLDAVLFGQGLFGVCHQLLQIFDFIRKQMVVHDQGY